MSINKIMVPVKQVNFKFEVANARDDVNEIINNTCRALNQIQAVGRIMGRSLERQHLILRRAKRRLSSADAIIIGNVLDEITEACYAVCEATDYFNKRVTDTLKHRTKPVTIRLAARNYKSLESVLTPSQKRLIKAASSLEREYTKRDFVKTFRQNPKQFTVKLRLPMFLVEAMGYETKLQRIAANYNNIISEISADYAKILKEMAESKYLLTKIDVNKYANVGNGISRIDQDLKTLGDSLTNLMQSFKDTQSYFINEASQNKTTVQKMGDKINSITSTVVNLIKAIAKSWMENDAVHVAEFIKSLQKILPNDSGILGQIKDISKAVADGTLLLPDAGDKAAMIADNIDPGVIADELGAGDDIWASGD